MHTSWLPLTDYSTKYKVSVSTLRRRIKAEDIKFRFEDGKYFIADETLSTHTRGPRPSQNNDVPHLGAHQSPSLSQEVLPTVNHLLGELKKAYTSILLEKEEQILLLKEEIADLKTLVSVLESENDRLKSLVPATQSQSQLNFNSVSKQKRPSNFIDDLFSNSDLLLE